MQAIEEKKVEPVENKGDEYEEFFDYFYQKYLGEDERKSEKALPPALKTFESQREKA